MWGFPHGSRPLAGGSTLLDWSWERPVSIGHWESGCWKEGWPLRELPRSCCVLRYLSPVVVGSLNEQLRNPELDTLGPDVPTRRRRLHLRAATARMKAAALGQDLDMRDVGEALKPTLQGPLTWSWPFASQVPPTALFLLLLLAGSLEPSPLPLSFAYHPTKSRPCSWNSAALLTLPPLCLHSRPSPFEGHSLLLQLPFHPSPPAPH